MPDKDSPDYANWHEPGTPATAATSAIACAAVSLVFAAMAAIAGPAPRPVDGPYVPVVTGAILLTLVARLIALIGSVVGLVGLVRAVARRQPLVLGVVGIVAPSAAFLVGWCVARYRLS